MTNYRVYISNNYRGNINLPTYWDANEKISCALKHFIANGYAAGSRYAGREENVREYARSISSENVHLIEEC